MIDSDDIHIRGVEKSPQTWVKKPPFGRSPERQHDRFTERKGYL